MTLWVRSFGSKVGPGGSCLVVEGPRGEILVPLAAHICVEVDLEGRRILIDPPEGLLELNETKRHHAIGGTQSGGRRL